MDFRRAWTDHYRKWWRAEQAIKNYTPLMRGQLAAILADPRLSATEKLVWLSIANRTSRLGEAELTVAEIASGAGIKERATQDAIKRLCEVGVLRRIQSTGNRAYTYFLVPPGQTPVAADSAE